MSEINKQSWFLLRVLISFYNIYLHPTGIYLFIIYIYLLSRLFIYLHKLLTYLFPFLFRPLIYQTMYSAHMADTSTISSKDSH